MIEQAVDRIRQIEEQAQKLIEEARRKKQEIIDTATNKGEEQLASVIKSEKTVTENRIREIESGAGSEAHHLLETASAKLSADRKKWTDRIPSAVDRLERFLIEDQN
ncbi:MAG: hypothetical protein PHQ23_05060 [Candidatus Wallbacteria bacterium]|nr:hypothetical protein [Candidatus Wallbacteria bacterium]